MKYRRENILYGEARYEFICGRIAWKDMDILACVVTSQRTLGAQSERLLSYDDVIAFGRLTGKTTTLGVADAEDMKIPVVRSGTAKRILIVRESDGFVIASIENFRVGKLTKNGKIVTRWSFVTGDTMVIRWNDEKDKIFKLGC